MTEERPPVQKVFPCWKCGMDLGQIPANLLLARWSEDGLRREYAHRQCENRVRPFEEGKP